MCVQFNRSVVSSNPANPRLLAFDLVLETQYHNLQQDVITVAVWSSGKALAWFAEMALHGVLGTGCSHPSTPLKLSSTEQNKAILYTKHKNFNATQRSGTDQMLRHIQNHR